MNAAMELKTAYFAGSLAYLEALDLPGIVWPTGTQPEAPAVPEGQRAPACLSLLAQVGVLHLIEAWRAHGFRSADLDPLRLHEPQHWAELDPARHGLTADDLDLEFETGNFGGSAQDTLRGILERLKAAYGGRLSAEFGHVSDPRRRTWLQQRLEGPCPVPLTAIEQRELLTQLTAAETLERLIHTRYVGQKRFSLEGGESLLPLLHEMVSWAPRLGVAEIGLAMSHRGRLNILQNLLGRSVFDLFRSAYGDAPEDGRGGDVKYHQGFTAQVRGAHGTVRVALSFNPSHLEIVSPVVEGWVRARQETLKDSERNRAMAIVVHGDAAFAGQGVVMETLNMAATRGFTTGGTIHIVLNNQIGFTTSDPRDTRSSLYCADVVKMVEAPILHINGDDPEAVVRAARIALEYRMAFHADIAINLICYRRLGHNEQDEPMVTQPLMYRAIKALPSTRERYAQHLIEQGVLRDAAEAEALIDAYRQGMDAAPIAPPQSAPSQWDRFRHKTWRAPGETFVSRERLGRLGLKLAELPAAPFALHPRVAAVQTARRKMAAGEQALDWGMAELLAYASLLEDGYSVRLSGQDSERGTFFHRHAVLHDQNRTERDRGVFVPLQTIAQGRARFNVVNSLLSEQAVLAFEYGYSSVASAETLVLWEAQFGDFVNGAQVVIDQFIAAGETKWGRLNGLTLLLPHGYEGQGPEHSSARIERFLQLAAEDNMQIVQPSLPAQVFHLLRRQMVRPYRKPLIVLTPKSLLRHPAAVSSFDDLVSGAFRPILDDAGAPDPSRVRRLVFCSGRLYFDLVAARQKRGLESEIALLRIEQFYPFPDEEFLAAIKRFPEGVEIVWAQDEPKNQGAWPYVLRQFLRFGLTWRYAGRPHSASPATGYAVEHKRQLEALIEEALG